MTPPHKYKIGTRLRVLSDDNKFDGWKKGDIIEIISNSLYGDSYEFKGMPVTGWNPRHIENGEKFEVVKIVKITNWKNELKY